MFGLAINSSSNKVLQLNLCYQTLSLQRAGKQSLFVIWRGRHLMGCCWHVKITGKYQRMLIESFKQASHKIKRGWRCVYGSAMNRYRDKELMGSAGYCKIIFSFFSKNLQFKQMSWRNEQINVENWLKTRFTCLSIVQATWHHCQTFPIKLKHFAIRFQFKSAVDVCLNTHEFLDPAENTMKNVGNLVEILICLREIRTFSLRSSPFAGKVVAMLSIWRGKRVLLTRVLSDVIFVWFITLLRYRAPRDGNLKP